MLARGLAVVVALAVVASALAYRAAVPTGLDASVRAAYESPDTTAVAGVECSRDHFLSSDVWVCAVTIDLVLLSDPTVTYRITLDKARCWRGVAIDRDSINDSLAPARLRGCLAD